MLRTGLVLSPGQTAIRCFGQWVPACAPSGIYKYYACVGDYPETVASSDTFEIHKLPIEGGAPINASNPSFFDGWRCEESFDYISESVFHESINLSVSPNPFNASTAARFELQAASNVKLAVYDIAGREIAVLADGFYPAGTHQAVWDASGMASGVYFARLSAGSEIETEKLLSVK